jgi:hypothetical protein
MDKPKISYRIYTKIPVSTMKRKYTKHPMKIMKIMKIKTPKLSSYVPDFSNCFF